MSIYLVPLNSVPSRSTNRLLQALREDTEKKKKTTTSLILSLYCTSLMVTVTRTILWITDRSNLSIINKKICGYLIRLNRLEEEMQKKCYELMKIQAIASLSLIPQNITSLLYILMNYAGHKLFWIRRTLKSIFRVKTWY